jgi:alpha-D-ribose 1-methylphosphonate 5-triphosphate diphosphatase
MDTVALQRESPNSEENMRAADTYLLRRQGASSGELSLARAKTATLWSVSKEARPAGETVLTNARVVVRDSMFYGTVHVVGDRIAGVSTGRSALSSATNLEGDLLIPGLIDVHTDNLERHLEPRAGVAWPNFAALITHDHQIAAAGVTTVFDSLCIGDQRRGSARSREVLARSMQALERAQADRLLKVEHFVHVRCEVSADDVVETFETLVENPFVRLVSVMDHTPGQRQWRDVERWRQFNLAKIPATELDEIYERRTNLGVEIAASARRKVARLCRQRGLVLASHDDTTQQHIAEAVENGVTISEFPTTGVAARFARSVGMRVVMGAPNIVLGGSHCGNVSARELAAEALVDGLASDYVPVSLIQACLLLHEEMGLPIPAAVAMVTAKPASMIGLSDRGEIAPGLRADLLWVKAHDHMPVVRGVWRAGQRVI